MAVPAMTDLDLSLTGSSRAGRPCHCPFVAWLISFRPSGARGSLARVSAFCEPLEQSLRDQRAPAGAAGLVHSRFEPELRSFLPSRAGLLLWCIQGFAKSAHPWLISSHPFGGGRASTHRRGGIRYRIYETMYLAYVLG